MLNSTLVPVLNQEFFALDQARHMGWKDITFDMFGLVFKYLRGVIVIFIAMVLSIMGFLHFGFKDAGTYYYAPDQESYTAGSLFSPDEYATYEYGILLSDDQSSADALNERLAQMRMRNLPGVILSAIVCVLLCAMFCYVVLAFFHVCGAAGKLAEPQAPRRWLLDAWRAEKGAAYTTSLAEDQHALPFGLVLYAFVLLGRSGGEQRLLQAGCSQEALRQAQAIAKTNEGRLVLLFATFGKTTSFMASSASQSVSPEMATAGFCPKCGNALPAGARFCGKCGNKLR